MHLPARPPAVSKIAAMELDSLLHFILRPLPTLLCNRSQKDTLLKFLHLGIILPRREWVGNLVLGLRRDCRVSSYTRVRGKVLGRDMSSSHYILRISHLIVHKGVREEPR